MTVGNGGGGASVGVDRLLRHRRERPEAPLHEVDAPFQAAARLLHCLRMVRRGVGPVPAAAANGPQLILPLAGHGRVIRPPLILPPLILPPLLAQRRSGLLTSHLAPVWVVVVPAAVVHIGMVAYVLPSLSFSAAPVGRPVRTARPRLHEHDPMAVLLGQLFGLYGLIGLVSVWPPAPVPSIDVEPEEELVGAGWNEPLTPSHRLRQLAGVGARWALVAVAVAVVGVSMGAGHQRSGSRREAAPGGARAGPPAAARAVPSPLGSGQPVTFAFAGDVHFEGVLRPKLASDPDGLLAPVRPVLASADLTVANLETAVTDRGVREDKQFNFRAPANAFRALGAAGVDVVTLANNHGLDYGLEGLKDTLTAAKAASVAVVGAGRDAAEAYAPYRTRIKGQRIAVIGATQVLDDHLVPSWTATSDQAGLASAKDAPRLTAEVREARAAADTVVVFVHWGIEGQTCPSSVQVGLARQLVDAGADIIVGGHAHRLQGAGRLGQAFVAYGLGNFVFYSRKGPGAESGVLEVTATGRRIDHYRWAPARIRDGIPRPSSGAQGEKAVRAWEALRACTGLHQ